MPPLESYISRRASHSAAGTSETVAQNAEFGPVEIGAVKLNEICSVVTFSKLSVARKYSV